MESRFHTATVQVELPFPFSVCLGIFILFATHLILGLIATAVAAEKGRRLHLRWTTFLFLWFLPLVGPILTLVRIRRALTPPLLSRP